MARTFSIDEARQLMPLVLEVTAGLVPIRAELARRVHDHNETGAGDIPQIKALEARMSELLDRLTAQDIQVKGYAPVLIDFPHEHDGRDVLLCWLEGEDDLGWFHDAAHGFMGRRRLSEL